MAQIAFLVMVLIAIIKRVDSALETRLILTHDFHALLSHLPDAPPDHAHQLVALTEYSLIRRYEKGYEILAKEDIKLALELAEQTLKWAKKVCGH